MATSGRLGAARAVVIASISAARRGPAQATGANWAMPRSRTADPVTASCHASETRAWKGTLSRPPDTCRARSYGASYSSGEKGSFAISIWTFSSFSFTEAAFSTVVFLPSASRKVCFVLTVSSKM